MPLIIALGSNLGNRQSNLLRATGELQQYFTLIKESKIIETDPVDYLDQQKFFNMVIEFKLPDSDIKSVFSILKAIEIKMGRTLTIPKGPRLIDIDLIFFGFKSFCDHELEVPHPRAYGRDFVMTPLKELPSYLKLKSHFNF